MLRRRMRLSRRGCILFFATMIGVFATLLLLPQSVAPAGEQRIADEFKCPVSLKEATGLFSLGNNHAWISLEDHPNKRGYVLRTADGGKRWLTAKGPRRISRIYFISSRLGWALRVEETRPGLYLPYLLRSTDGGRTWQQLSSKPLAAAGSDGLHVVSLAFADSKHGWLVGSSPSRVVVYQTVDGGKTVQKVSEIPGIGNCLGMYVSPGAGLWIYGEGFALNSRDGGRTWKDPLDLKELGTNQYALSISSAWFFRDGRGFLVGASPDALILSTTDYGRHWHSARSSQDANSFRSISFRDESHGCVVGFSKFLTCTDDGGSTWRSENVLPAAQYIQCTSFSGFALLESGRGWAVRDGGFLYETTDFGQTWHPFDPLSLTSK
jgi:photosystem II stability/assembly factor-like uncharacterized protein